MKQMQRAIIAAFIICVFFGCAANSGRTALIKASIDGDKKLAEQLIEKGANVNAKDHDGGTALMYASEKGYKDIYELLIKKGAEMNEKEYDKWIEKRQKKGNDENRDKSMDVAVKMITFFLLIPSLIVAIVALSYK